MPTLVLLRHGQSTWNAENRFTGWTDVPLSTAGEAEARAAGALLRAERLAFDLAVTSVLRRAIKTLWLALEALELEWIPVVRDWRWNERHYGALQGLDKAETAARHGEAQVQRWRRSYAEPPPAVTRDDPRWPGHDPRYGLLAPAQLPCTESLADTVARVGPAFDATVAPALRAGRRVLLVAHGNSLRGLVKRLDGVSDADIVELNIPTGVPLVYDLDDALRPRVRGGRYLGDAAAIAKAAAAVAGQGKAR
jgi:2,3-bisphosphoglycerate-dependent phosphoglycerate mutase